MGAGGPPGCAQSILLLLGALGAPSRWGGCSAVRPRLEDVGAVPHLCPLQGTSTSPSPPRGGDRGGGCAHGEGCSRGCSPRWEPFPFTATESGVGEAAQPGGHCPVPPWGAGCGVSATFPSPKPSPLPNLPPARMQAVLGVLLLLFLGEFPRELSCGGQVPACSPCPFSRRGGRPAPSVGQPGCAAEPWLGVGVGCGSAALPEPLRKLCSALRVPWAAGSGGPRLEEFGGRSPGAGHAAGTLIAGRLAQRGCPLGGFARNLGASLAVCSGVRAERSQNAF